MVFSPDIAKKTVLIVEDDHALRELYRITLISAGYAVVAVEDGVDALRYVEAHTPNLVLLDLELPRLSGLDVQRELAAHKETRSVPIVVVTGADTRAVRSSDFEALLKKPVSNEVLVAEIEHALSVAHLRESVTMSADQREHQRAPGTILVVDDEAGMQKFLTLFLEARGYGVKTAGSVGEGIMVLEHSIVDAVILDVRMPKRSGLALLDLIRLDKRLSDFPVLILTGATLTASEQALIAGNHADLFYKSGNLESLAVRLERVLG